MASCPNCGSTLDLSAIKCSKCGAEFSGASSWKPITDGRSTRRDIGWTAPELLSIGAAVLGVIAWAVVILIAMQRSLEMTGSMETFRFNLGRTLHGIGLIIAVIALAAGILALVLSKSKRVPWVGFFLSGSLILLAQINFR